MVGRHAGALALLLVVVLACAGLGVNEKRGKDRLRLGERKIAAGAHQDAVRHLKGAVDDLPAGEERDRARALLAEQRPLAAAEAYAAGAE